MRLSRWQRWLLVVASAALQIFIFPTSGPLPGWRSWLAFIALVPLLMAILAPCRDGNLLGMHRAALLGYGCGILFYAGNCYWIYQTMYLYGGMGKPLAFIILVLFSLYLGLYHALFGWLLAVCARRGAGFALAAAPFLWVAVELARARITCFPWDQLGMSLINNHLINRLGPWTGVYGVSLYLSMLSALIAALILRERNVWNYVLGPIALCGVAVQLAPQHLRVPPATTTATLLQPNIAEGDSPEWMGSGYTARMQQLTALSEHPPAGSDGTTLASVIVWPESPAPLIEQDPRLQIAAAKLAHTADAALIVGDVSRTRDFTGRAALFNSASFFAADGTSTGRYDKMHLVPFGEYIPFANLFTFARALTANAGDMTPGRDRVMFHTGGHTYGVFICYESIFADEVRQFANKGADVLVNISDDGWYGETSAPWQHLDMARMRAIENHRWVLEDTNTGLTAAIDPNGRITQQAPTHERTAIRVGFGYDQQTTFYTRHGDWFAYAVTILAGAFLVMSCFAKRAGTAQFSDIEVETISLHLPSTKVKINSNSKDRPPC